MRFTPEQQAEQRQAKVDIETDRIKAYWSGVRDFAALQVDLLSLPDHGRFKGVCESWFCSMWQHGTSGADRAVAIAKRKGWASDKERGDRLEAIFNGNLTMARAGDEVVETRAKQLRLSRCAEVKTGGVNVWDAWESRKLIG